MGDTVTNAAHPCEEPLPGYKKSIRWYTAACNPADGAKYPDLRDALEKLQINDASLQYEPETSLALGFWIPLRFLRTASSGDRAGASGESFIWIS